MTQSEVYDVTYSWRDIAIDTCTDAPSGFLGGTGNYSVAQYADSYVSVAWSPSTDVDAKMKFVDRTEPYPEHYVVLRDSPSAYYADIVYQNGVGFQCMPFQSGPYTSNDPSGPNGTLPYMAYFTTYPVIYPDNYGGSIIPAAEPRARYVAMGDSFSSGEGNAPYEFGTDLPNNRCHRSPVAYPRLLEDDPSLDLGVTHFVACSGATTDNVLHGGTGSGAWSEPSQVSNLSGDTMLVTITIGGNDVGFADYVKGCYSTLCGYGTPAYNAITSSITSSTFQDDLKETYLAILEGASSADVYVVNYPYIVRDRSAEGCTVFPGGLTSNDAGAEQVTTMLNTAILSAYLDIKQDIQWSSYASRLHFVQANGAGSPFNDQDLCGGDAVDTYFYQLDLYDITNPKTMHPTLKGQTAYSTVIKGVIS